MFSSKARVTRERVRDRYAAFCREKTGGVGGLSTGEKRSRAGVGANLGAGRRRSERAVLQMYTNCSAADGGVRAHGGATCANSYRRSLTSAVAAAARAFMHHYNMPPPPRAIITARPQPPLVCGRRTKCADVQGSVVTENFRKL